MVKQVKFKDIKIFNQAIICPHGNLPFNENLFDQSMVTIVSSREWLLLTESFIYDKLITVIKTQASNNEMNGDTSKEKFNFIFEPLTCEICLEKNELDKYLFENKKIFIRLIDEDDLPKSDIKATSNTIQQEDAEIKNNDDIIELPQKKSRLGDIETIEEKSPKLNDNKDLKLIKINLNQPCKPSFINSSNLNSSASGTRRSKRTRKLKGDIEISASSYDTIKQVKVRIISHLNRIISEQHLFFCGNELENDKTLAEYKINPNDILYLQVLKLLRFFLFK